MAAQHAAECLGFANLTGATCSRTMDPVAADARARAIGVILGDELVDDGRAARPAGSCRRSTSA